MSVQKVQLSKADERQTTLSLYLGITVWFLHLNAVYALASVACKWGWLSFTVAGLPALELVLTIITFIALLLMLLMIYLPWRSWRKFQSEKPRDNPQMLQDTERDRRPLAAFIAMLLNSLFFLFIIATFVPIFALDVCAQA